MNYSTMALFLAVVPEVNITANHDRVDALNPATLTCSVIRGSPMIYSYRWFYEGSVISNETSAILTGVGRFGTYMCKVTNEVGVGMDIIFLNFSGEYCMF